MKMTCREEAGANTDFVLQICSETLPVSVKLPSTASLQLDLDAISFQQCIKTVSLIVQCADVAQLCVTLWTELIAVRPPQ